MLFTRNLTVEVYWASGKRRAVVTRELREIRERFEDHVDSKIIESVISSLIDQSTISNAFPNVVLFIDDNRFSVGLREFLELKRDSHVT